ncbi:Card1-like endonuclease domain-containing protein [Aggregatibacter segnis]|uniref:DUF1887 domain-containing protein n=1 Tax=Aggregatibacter segnis ATCC 33393 TaxID=888057 RepID=E6L006_9PAST|nr:DUF1887 family CARF protein [Aggregatibacter segnis]EFU66964.1 conserved hypothetical protein [Aggregatibacter segnis ATCC 33393]QQB10416.1 DUF1887 family protein [Aggregatibacter segnis]SQH63780.1 Domain of uncharacterised function (DUF1887) [Aggregatibacter segnis ATCC 33393]
MQKYDIHVCLVSDQAAPNLLPILDSEFKPQKAVFVVSTKDEIKEKANSLKLAFKQNDIDVDILELSNEFDFQSMETELFDLLSSYENENIALNVTGGTKLMAIAAQNVFSGVKPIFYINTNKEEIIFISKENDKHIPVQKLNTKTLINTYLSSYGVSVLKNKDDFNFYKLGVFTERFVRRQEDYKDIISKLNLLAFNASNSKLETNFTNYSNDLKLILEDLADEDLVRLNGDIVDFKNEQTRSFLNGNWLEYFTYKQANSIADVIDADWNVEVVNSKYEKNKVGVNNELDVIFMAKNKCHIIECKTINFENTENKDKLQSYLDKLNSLKGYGGSLTKVCLVSFYAIPQNIKRRAEKDNIEIIDDYRIKNLKERIQSWIKK